MAHGGPNLCHKNSESTRPQILFAGLSLPPGLGAERDPLTLRAIFPAHQPGGAQSRKLGFSPASAWGLHAGMGASQFHCPLQLQGGGPQRSNLGTRAPHHMWCLLCKKRDASPTLGGNEPHKPLSPCSPSEAENLPGLEKPCGFGWGHRQAEGPGYDRGVLMSEEDGRVFASWVDQEDWWVGAL